MLTLEIENLRIKKQITVEPNSIKTINMYNIIKKENGLVRYIYMVKGELYFLLLTMILIILIILQLLNIVTLIELNLLPT